LFVYQGLPVFSIHHCLMSFSKRYSDLQIFSLFSQTCQTQVKIESRSNHDFAWAYACQGPNSYFFSRSKRGLDFFLLLLASVGFVLIISNRINGAGLTKMLATNLRRCFNPASFLPFLKTRTLVFLETSNSQQSGVWVLHSDRFGQTTNVRVSGAPFRPGTRMSVCNNSRPRLLCTALTDLRRLDFDASLTQYVVRRNPRTIKAPQSFANELNPALQSFLPPCSHSLDWLPSLPLRYLSSVGVTLSDNSFTF